MAELMLNPMPYIAKTVSLPSSHLKVTSVYGIKAALQYKFVAGRPLTVEDAKDVEYLLKLTRWVPGPGGQGKMEIPLVTRAVSDGPKPLTAEEKLEKLTEKIAKKFGISLDDLVDAEASDEIVADPDDALDVEDDSAL